MLRCIISVLLITCLFRCRSDESKEKSIKYFFEDRYLDCVAIYEKGAVKDVYCLDAEGDTIVSEIAKIDNESGVITKYFKKNKIKEHGRIVNNKRVGEWKGYFKNGDLRYYHYYSIDSLREKPIYSKFYDTLGHISHSYLPLEFRKDSLPIELHIDVDYKLYVDLLFSQFDTTNCFFFVDEDSSNSLSRDSFYYAGSSIVLEFNPKTIGEHIISGTYFEVPVGMKVYDFNFIAEYPVEFKFEVQ